MYSAIAANKRNTVFIILIFLLIIGGLGALVAWYFNDWSIAIIVFVDRAGCTRCSSTSWRRGRRSR